MKYDSVWKDSRHWNTQISIMFVKKQYITLVHWTNIYNMIKHFKNIIEANRKYMPWKRNFYNSYFNFTF